MTPEEMSQRINQALLDEDLDGLTALESEFTDDGESLLPFQASVRLRGQEQNLEANVGIGLANKLSRAKRKVKYQKKIKSGYSGPKIVSEGDSWFQYPIKLDDVIDNLMDTYAVLSLGAAGDTLSNMLASSEYLKALEDESANFFLFSASGNDALGGGNLASMLYQYDAGMEIKDLVKKDALEETLAKIEAGYTAIISQALAVSPRITILFHGYDSPIPRSDGRWLGMPMQSRGVPNAMQGKVVRYLVDQLNERLSILDRRFPNGAFYVDCRGQVGDLVQNWYDELHPRNPGFSRVAYRFSSLINEIHRGSKRSLFEAAIQSSRKEKPLSEFNEELLQAEEEIVTDYTSSVFLTSTKSPSVKRNISQSDKEILDEYQDLLLEQSKPDEEDRLRARRYMVNYDDSEGFERILGKSNLFPINYLSRGTTKSRAVAKVQLFLKGEVPVGSGSGFLVAPGLLLTNNHVINTRETAVYAKAVFDYQEDDRYQSVPAKVFNITDDIFFTSERDSLDFTFVSVAAVNESGDSLSDFGKLTLIEESGKAVKGEMVSIIQHPRGGYKSIALRDSRIIGVKGDFIYYSTDTEPGSSGSPVLNDQWLTVALHHRSVPHPSIEKKWIANRGIRISRIISALRDAAAREDPNAIRILELIDAERPYRPAPISIDERPLRQGEIEFIPSIYKSYGDSELPTEEEERFNSNRWDGVQGYDPAFLSKEIELPLPENMNNVRMVNGRPDLPYLHFSVVMHESRKLPILTACNVDGRHLHRLNRQGGGWKFDPRLPDSAQVGNEAYRSNDYDRGHLVRRLAPMWGSREEARFAEADTFHYTVAAPQHSRLNQKIWLELEDYLLDWASANKAKLSIYTGPIFRPDDPLYRGIVKIPADYWKVAVAEGPLGLRSVGYLHTQKNLIPTVEEAFGEYKTHRVPIHVLEELSGIELSEVANYDVAGGAFESIAVSQVVRGPEDIGL